MGVHRIGEHSEGNHSNMGHSNRRGHSKMNLVVGSLGTSRSGWSDMCVPLGWESVGGLYHSSLRELVCV